MSARRAMPGGGEVAVVGLGKSGVAAARLLRKNGYQVYASDSGASDGARRGAQALEALGADAVAGGCDVDRVARAALVVVSPGVPPEAPPLAAARARGTEIISEIELALRCMRPVPYVAVTGTNGKTTTTALVGHLLRALGHETVDAGNIGTPLTDVAFRDTPPAWVALELSSFQLHDTPSIDPTVGVLTNLAPDHLDRYASVEEYYADKAMLFANASDASRWVLNADDAASRAMTASVAGERHYFTVRDAPGARDEVDAAGAPNPPTVSASYDRATGQLVCLGAPLLSRADLPLLGDHNVANTLAAALAVMLADEAHQAAGARDAIAGALRSFRAPPHRLELVGEWDGVQWINDSKATNVSSTYVAVAGMTRPTVLLLGGRHKGEPYAALAEPIRAHVKRVIAYGEAAPIVEHDLRGVVPVDHVAGDFTEVVARARAAVAPGDAVLLSPACSSYDMFDNYEHRGATFRDLARPAVPA